MMFSFTEIEKAIINFIGNYKDPGYQSDLEKEKLN